MKQTVKRIRYLRLMRRENVAEEKLPRLDEALKHNEPLFTGYLLKEALGLLWKHRINNGRMEAINNKITALLRQTYGLRDERYLVLRLLSLHVSRQELLG